MTFHSHMGIYMYFALYVYGLSCLLHYTFCGCRIRYWTRRALIYHSLFYFIYVFILINRVRVTGAVRKFFFPCLMENDDEASAPLYQLDSECKYHDIESLNTIDFDGSFNIIHINSRSLNTNFKCIDDTIQSTTCEFSVIGISETWALSNNNNDVLYKLDDYNSIFKCREHKTGGGVALYINNKYDYSIRHDLMSTNPLVYESLFCEIALRNEKPVVVGVVYRPPGTNTELFNAEFGAIVNALSASKTQYYIMGDFNIDLINQENKHSNDFLNMMTANSSVPLIDKPTRVTDLTATLIDNIFTDITHVQYTHTGILTVGISDHLPVFCLNSNCKSKENKRDQYEYRKVTEEKIQQFKHTLERETWHQEYNEFNPNAAYLSFSSKFTTLYNFYFPLKRTKFRYNKTSKPWYSLGLLSSIRHKTKLYRQALKSGTIYDREKYRVYRNRLNHVLRCAEKRYYSDKLAFVQNNLRETWKILKYVISCDRGMQFPTEFLWEDKSITNKKDIANGFNSYFINVGPNLASKIPHTDGHINDYLGNNINTNFFLTPIVVNEVLQVANNLNTTKSPGIDAISPRIVKSTIDSFADVLTDIFNKSYQQGIVPNLLKIAMIIPLYKDGERKLFSNYRPISILPCISKILERLTYNRLVSYFISNNLFSNSQFGFRKGHSTYMALLKLVDQLTVNHDNDLTTVAIFLDLSKAFDTIDHSILLKKLHHYGVRGITNDWIKDYLSNRTQYVSFNGTLSEGRVIRCGVPQGSILGPLLFIIYINDFINTSALANFLLFADDTNIFFSHNDPHQLSTVIEHELPKIETWFKLNKLSLNIKKTHYMVFGKRAANLDWLKVGDYDQVTETKFLGVIIDSNMTWSAHISQTSKKVARAIGVLNKARKCLPVKTLLTLYSTLVLPHLNYCNIIWASNYPTRLKPLVTLQKRAIRIISNAPYLAHSAPIFKRNHMLNLLDINKHQIGTFVYASLQNLLPPTIADHLAFNFSTHRHFTRNTSNLRVPQHRSVRRSYAIPVAGPKCWNLIPAPIQNKPSIYSFKRAFKAYLLTKYCD